MNTTRRRTRKRPRGLLHAALNVPPTARESRWLFRQELDRGHDSVSQAGALPPRDVHTHRILERTAVDATRKDAAVSDELHRFELRRRQSFCARRRVDVKHHSHIRGTGDSLESALQTLFTLLQHT